MYEQLVDEIMTEVLRRLQSVNSKSSVLKKSLLVLYETPYYCSDKLQGQYNVTLKDLNSISNQGELKPLVTAADFIVVTALDVKQLAELALGCGEGHLTKAIRLALLLGKSVFILENGIVYRFYKATASRNFYRRLIEYEEILKGYGIQIISEDMLFLLEKKEAVIKTSMKDIVNNTQIIIPEYEKEETIELDKKLILEKDLMDLNIRTNTVICIEKNSIVTPSALDFARAHRIRFMKK